MTSKRRVVELFLLEILVLFGAWIAVVVSESSPNLDDFEYTFQRTFLTPTTNTEPIPFATSTSPASKEVTTLENKSQELYDQIFPSSDPTTPLSRNYLHKMWSNYHLETPSTQATTINAPPLFHSKF